MSEATISGRIKRLKKKAMETNRYVSIEQALLITHVYQENLDRPRIIQRALALKEALCNMRIAVDEDELIVGNRTMGVRDGVVFPESGCFWINQEFESLPTRPQDPFNVRQEDIKIFRTIIEPFWQGQSMDDCLRRESGELFEDLSKVVKINQTDHAQGHICPNCATWLEKGPSGLKRDACEKLEDCVDEKSRFFYESVILVMEGAECFIERYADHIRAIIDEKELSADHSLRLVETICRNLSTQPPQTFHEAVQALWFLFVILHMESNASSFSPGRMDRYLDPFYARDLDRGILDEFQALEILECLWIKFNEIVYLRNRNSAKYFAGFPIGFNIALGGVDEAGKPHENSLTHLLLKAQLDLGLPQPNLSVRLHRNISDHLLIETIKVVAKGSGMPQFFNDEAIIEPLVDLGIDRKDAMDYAIVGCVELTTQGNNLGWSDAAMFNLNKVLELTLNHGECLIDKKRIGLDLGSLATYATFEELEAAFAKQISHFIERMIAACEVVEKAHQKHLPSPFLSAVVDDCLKKGIDVTQGGAKYNFSGIQMIQIANLADSLASLKQLVYDERLIDRAEMLQALRDDFVGHERIKAMIDGRAERYGNDIDWVDELGVKWARFFADRLKSYVNYRGGRYHTGMYTVSAHVPMGENVGASPDGRRSRMPLADGGVSPVYGRDTSGPTAVLKSVSKIDNRLTANGGLLNMKFIPEFFNEAGINKFKLLLRGLIDLKVPHAQFNVVRKKDLIAAQDDPDRYRSLTIRVAGYTAYFVELDKKLQDEIIARTSYGED